MLRFVKIDQQTVSLSLKKKKTFDQEFRVTECFHISLSPIPRIPRICDVAEIQFSYSDFCLFFVSRLS